ncbi:TonB-dependent receptor domain-containing protein [Lewinella sp. 4G2]|uniref:TonB-dependent receptor domain-containing protein n=1 Tax=Lewinella sp. 4G2 TaxID=1803372 RepID=UPI0007E06875|nr:TonB-dependent receptor [Lewinella sp. 4G2]OAV42704.1 TonB-dependent receptor [Lewinella sp. 4G2]
MKQSTHSPRLLLAAILLLCTSHLFAQTGTVTGRINDSDGSSVPFANVILYRDSVFSKAGATNDEGVFSISSVEEGTYDLAVSALGFTTSHQALIVTDRSQDVGTLIVTADATLLTEATIVAEKPIVQILPDKTVFNVDKSIAAAGNSAWELLRKAPGVILDNSGSVILEGKTGVQFYINGKETPLRGEALQGYLESLQATDVASIELITQPSSKYDAAGAAGIINIVLEKNESLGTNGTVSAGFTQGSYRRYNSGLTLNHRTTKSNLYGSYGGRYGESDGFLFLRREQNGTEFDARTISLYDRKSHNFRVGYDLYATERSTFGAELSLNRSYGNYTTDSQTPIRPLNAEAPSSVLVADNSSEWENTNYTANLNYVYEDTSGTSLTIDLNVGQYQNDADLFQPNRYFNGSRTQLISEAITAQQTLVDVDLRALKVDYARSLAGGTLSGGAKYSIVSTDNDFDFFQIPDASRILDEGRSNRFAYQEAISAAYLNFSRKLGAFDVQFGLRMENTDSDGRLSSTRPGGNDRVARNYTDWFPSGGVTYRVGRQHQFALKYGRRITRPNYNSLNPFESQIDELSSRRGNPFLQPQYANTLKLSHTFKYTLNTSLSYTRVNDFFAQITEADGDERNFISIRNIANQEVINLGVSYPFSLSKWARSYVSVNAYTSSYEATRPGFVALTQQTLSLYAQTTFTLPAKVSLEVSGWYSSPSVWGGTYESRSLGSLNVAVQRKFFHEKLNARIAANDVLFTSPWEGTTRFGNLFIEGTGGGDSRYVNLSLSYNFGNDRVKKARKRSSAVQEEQGRIQ